MRGQLPSVSKESVWKAQVRWLICGRWVFSAFLGLLGILAASSDIVLPATPLLTLALLFSVLNLVYAFLDHHFHFHRRIEFEVPMAAQLATDVVLLAVLVHYTGGTLSPFFSMFLAPAVAATLLLRPRLALGATLFCAAAPMMQEWLVASGALPRHPLPKDNALLDWFPWLLLCLTLCFTFLVGRNRVGVLKGREERLTGVNDRLVQQLEELLESREPTTAPYRRALVAEMATELARHIREPLGIMRARAESLRLSTENPRGLEYRRDLDVLLLKLDEASRGLRGILAFLPRPSGRQGEILLEQLLAEEMQRLSISNHRIARAGLAALPSVVGSHDEFELATGLLLKVCHEHALPGQRVRVRARTDPDRAVVRIEIRFPSEVDLSLGPSNELSHGLSSEDHQATFLRLATSQRIVEKHGGVLRVASRGGRTDILVEVPLAESRPTMAQPPFGLDKAAV